MSDLETIDDLFDPGLIKSLRLKSPVTCKIWVSEESYDTITLEGIYPFDTLDTVKQSITVHMEGKDTYLPQFLFVALQQDDGSFTPLDSTWYPPGIQEAERILYLPEPAAAMENPVKEFIVRGGGKPPLVSNPRGRMMLEDVFKDTIPTFYVFPFSKIRPLYKGVQPISEGDWYQRFYPFYPTLDRADPTKISKADRNFVKIFTGYLAKRKVYLRKINRILEGGSPLPPLAATGVHQVRLRIQQPSEDFEDCQTLFYETKVYKEIPYMRIIPRDGTPITKILVGTGILPIPDLDNPEIISQWAKEPTPTMGQDFLMLKYVHRAAMGTLCPLYGTIRIFHDGTADITVQPPKNIRKLEPDTDFPDFSTLLQRVCRDLPLNLEKIELGEAAMTFQLDAERGSAKISKLLLKKRLRFFSPFFQELTPLKDTLVSLRYRAVSNYASESSFFAFLTQYTEARKLEGNEPNLDMVLKFQEEFQLSELDARKIIYDWTEQNGTLSVAVPEENEFMEFFNPGIDIHIYGPGPTYTFHIHRIDSYATLCRLYSLLRILFSEDTDNILTESEATATKVTAAAAILETRALESEKSRVRDREAEEAARSTVSGVLDEDTDTDEEEEAKPDLFSRLRKKSKVADAEPKTEAKPDAEESVVVKKRVAVKPREEEENVDPASWFLHKLSKTDPGLFKYTSTVPNKSYARRCGATDERMPAVLTKAEFEDMLDEYKPETDAGILFFNIYPLKKGDVEKIRGQGGIKASGATEITVSRYASSMARYAKENYYFCPALFCLQDNKMVLESDFEADVDRKGEPKDPKTCPFCRGTEIPLPHKTVVPGATVFRRKVKKNSKPLRPHLFIGFASKIQDSTHPDGLGAPCCHVLKKTLRIADEEYVRLQRLNISSEAGVVLETVIDEEGEEEEAPEVELPRADAPNPIAYQVLFNKLYKTYIKDEEKHPLTPGDPALLPAPFDVYFQQNSATFVGRVSSQQKPKAKSQGFLRIGIEQGPSTAKCDSKPRPAEALLGVLAPLLYSNSIEEVRNLFLTAVEGPGGVKTFVNANFGNLVNEFYVPSDPDLGIESDFETIMNNPKVGITEALRMWASNHLSVQVNDTNHYAIRRIYKSYNRFVSFLKDTSQRKDLRHLSSFLTEPTLLSTNRRGLQLIVLEWSYGQESVRVRCSPYGFSLERHLEDDFAFVWFNPTDGLYELILYMKNVPASGGDRARRETVHRWKYSDKNSDEYPWPRIVRDRINEYMSKCQSEYSSLFTSQMNIDSSTLVPLSVALTTTLTIDYKEGRKKDVEPYGLVRDSYNHAVFVLYPVKPKGIKPSSPMIAMPVLDDGYLPKFQQLYLDIKDVVYAPADVAADYYTKYLTTTFSSYPGYTVRHIVRKKRHAEGIQLANGIYIPTGDTSVDLSAYSDTTRQVDEWDINRRLVQPCDQQDITDSTGKRLEELYQYFRYSVSNWLAADAGPDVRDSIEEIVFNDRLPDYEKRKRLEILCGRFTRGTDEVHGWLGWMQPDDKDWDRPTGLLRKDCRVQDEASCTEPCVWKSDSKTCALHVPVTTEIRSIEPQTVNTRILFSRRVIDELVRFPKRRLELLENEVSKISALLEPIREGDQYIIPERGMNWLSLLRLDWRPPEQETPQFYEEMGQEETEAEAEADTETETEAEAEAEAEEVPGEEAATGTAGPVPEEVLDLVGTKMPYQVWSSGLKGIADVLKVPLEQLGPKGDRFSEAGLQAYITKSNIPVATIDVTGPSPALQFRKGTGEPNRALVLLYQKGKTGLLIDRPGKPLVKISKLRGPLKEAWDSASRVVAAAPSKLRQSVVVTKAAEEEPEPAPFVSTLLRKKTVAPVAPVAPPAPEEPEPAAPVVSTLRRKTVAPAAPAAPVEPEPFVSTLKKKTVAPVAPVAPPAPEEPEPAAPVVSTLRRKTVAPIVPAAPVEPEPFVSTLKKKTVAPVAPAPAAPVEPEPAPIVSTLLRRKTVAPVAPAAPVEPAPVVSTLKKKTAAPEEPEPAAPVVSTLRRKTAATTAPAPAPAPKEPLISSLPKPIIKKTAAVEAPPTTFSTTKLRRAGPNPRVKFDLPPMTPSAQEEPPRAAEIKAAVTASIPFSTSSSSAVAAPPPPKVIIPPQAIADPALLVSAKPREASVFQKAASAVTSFFSPPKKPTIATSNSNSSGETPQLSLASSASEEESTKPARPIIQPIPLKPLAPKAPAKPVAPSYLPDEVAEDSD
jgi:hypothetical protein